MKNAIEIVRTSTGYNVRHIGAQAADIVELFGTNEIPTPFTLRAAAQEVVREIKRLNPDCDVYLAA